MAVSVAQEPWEFTAQADAWVPDKTAAWGLTPSQSIRPYIYQIVIVQAAAGSVDVREELDGQTLTGVVTIGAAGNPVVIPINKTVTGIYIQTLSGTGNKVLVYPGRR